MKLKIEYHDWEDTGRFFAAWVKELERGTPETKEIFENLGKKWATKIIDAIPKKLDKKYGAFMAARTQIEVQATQTGFRLVVSGKFESELSEGSKIKDNGRDYNLWAFYEFGGEVGERTTKGGMKIQKDVASVATIKKLARGFRIQGKQGAIQALIMGFQPQIDRDVKKAMQRYINMKVKKTAEKAAKKVGKRAVRGMQIWIKQGLDPKDIPIDTAEIVRAAVNREGIPSLAGRWPAGTVIDGQSVGGQFRTLGTTVRKSFHS